MEVSAWRLPGRAARDRYREGVPRRLALLSVALVVGLAPVGCSAGGGGGIGGAAAEEAACPLIERMRSAGDLVAEADVADPEAFEKALDDAVADYLSTLDALVDVVPEELANELGTLRASVEQYRFDDATAARAPLDEWAADTCAEAVGESRGDTSPVRSPSGR